MAVTLIFHGAAGTVTGSCYRVVHPGGQFLVDCGMFQGNKTVRALNLKPLPFDPQQIDFLLLTHAHIDHSGLLPKLTHHGYKNPIHATEPTIGLLDFLPPDPPEFRRARRSAKAGSAVGVATNLSSRSTTSMTRTPRCR